MRSLEKFFFFLLIVLLPTQLGLHLWPNWAFVAGIRVDYLSPTFYLTDTLIAGLLFCSLFTSDWYRKKNNLFVILGIIVFALANSLVTANPWVSLLKWGKILELVFLALYIISANKEWLKETVAKVLPFSIILFALIGFAQTVLGGTIGGPLYFLGERSFSTITPGIALYSLFGKLFLRPYSTFPHPNVFGAYMFMSVFILAVLKPKKSWFDRLAMFAGFTTAILSGSLAVYAGMIVVFVLILFGQRFPSLAKAVPTAAIVISLGFLLISPNLSLINSSEALTKRISLARASATMVSKAPLFGVGLNNFIVNLPSYAAGDSSLWILQPVHNIFLLTFVETGIVGLLLFGYLLQRVLSKKSPLGLAIIFVIVTGLADHYWLTIQQTQILFTLLLGFLW